MANALYGKGREAFGGKKIDWGNDNIKVTLIDTANYSVDIDVDQYMNLDTVPANAKIAVSGNLSGKSFTLGVADADDETFSTVSGAESEALIIWLDGGDGGTSQSGTNDLLIAYIDTATGLPVTPGGGDIIIQFDSGANKIFKL